VLFVGGEERSRDAFEPVHSRSSEIWRPAGPSLRAGVLEDNAELAVALALPGGRAILITDAPTPWIASPGASVWTRGTRYPHPPSSFRGGFASALEPDGKVLFVNESGKADSWDPATDAWTGVASLPFRVEAPELVALADGRMLLVGSPSVDPDGTQFQVWTPGGVAWQECGVWDGYGRVTIHRAVQLTGGEVLVLRRVSTGLSTGLHDATLWDPATGHLRSIEPPMASIEDGSTLTPLEGGLALLVGAPAPELWSARESAWAKLPAPDSPLRHSIAVRLDGHHVLIAGGDGKVESHFDTGPILTSAASGLGVLVLLIGAIAAVRAFRPSIIVLVVTILIACFVAGAIYAFLSVPRGGG
jgi:hypothetical protein